METMAFHLNGLNNGCEILCDTICHLVNGHQKIGQNIESNHDYENNVTNESSSDEESTYDEDDCFTFETKLVRNA